MLFSNCKMLISKLILCIILANSAYSAKILGVFYMDSYSHFILGERILKELASRGHEVTMISTFPQKTPIKNYRDVDLPEIREHLAEMKNDNNMMKFGSMSVIVKLILFAAIGPNLSEKVFSSKSVQNLLQSNATFDLVIMEQFFNEAHHGFAYHYKAPMIVLSTVGSSNWVNRLVGNVANPSFTPDHILSYSPTMNFYERTINTLYMTLQAIVEHVYYLPRQNENLHRYFPDAPHINDLIYNTSLVFLNSHSSFMSPVPIMPSMIEIGGFHVQTSGELPKSLKQFLDDSKEGVVYFSMGSNLQSKALPNETRDAILKSFVKLKMNVLWKWEDDKLPGQPSNVRIEKWLPQPAVLEHPNVLVFVTHGGRMSTIEAIHYGLPIIGIPVFADQYKNMAEAAHLGYGISLPFNEVNENNLDDALKEIIENPKYAKVAKSRSNILRNQPVKPIDNAMYWIESVLANKGAPYLRSAALDLQWYQYFLLDVISFLILLMVAVFAIFYIVVKKLLLRKKKEPKRKTT